MLFNIALFLSQATAQVDVSKLRKPTLIEEPQYQVEDSTMNIRDSVEVSKDQGAVTLDVCGELKGRKLFRNAIIGIPLGTILTLGSIVVILDSIDSSITPEMVATFYSGLGMLVVSGIALPISVHKLHRDALKKGYTPVFSEEALYIFDFAIIMGPFIGAVIPPLLVTLPAGYLLHLIHGLDIVKEVRKEQKRVCGSAY